MSLFIPTSIDQNLLPPPLSIDIVTSNDRLFNQQCSTASKITDMSFANVPFQQHVLLLPTIGAIAQAAGTRQGRMLAIIRYYNSIPQPPGTVLVFHDWLSITYGVNNKIIKAQRCFKNVVSRPEIVVPPPPECVVPEPPVVCRRSGRKTKTSKKYIP